MKLHHLLFLSAALLTATAAFAQGLNSLSGSIGRDLRGLRPDPEPAVPVSDQSVVNLVPFAVQEEKKPARKPVSLTAGFGYLDDQSGGETWSTPIVVAMPFEHFSLEMASDGYVTAKSPTARVNGMADVEIVAKRVFALDADKKRAILARAGVVVPSGTEVGGTDTRFSALLGFNYKVMPQLSLFGGVKALVLDSDQGPGVGRTTSIGIARADFAVSPDTGLAFLFARANRPGAVHATQIGGEFSRNLAENLSLTFTYTRTLANPKDANYFEATLTTRF